MKIEGLILGVLFCVCCVSTTFVPPRPGYKPHLLGTKECTWGPGYWCQNLTAAAGCRAVKHCIQTVWIHKQLPPDTSSVCQTCLDMVKQARDQLESNETQELIKEVFEGTCALIKIKPIVKECDKIADDYIPELIDTLASEMNPQVVCSVAGLCNNEKLLVKKSAPPKMSKCDGCKSVVGIMEQKFNQLSRDDFLNGLLMMCGKFGSLSDACSNIVITYFNEIYKHVQENFHPRDICLMAGECVAQFHVHPDVEITPISQQGYVDVNSQDDLPCELCEQLVNHLKDLLIANTTVDEFKLVLQGLCKQTKSFSAECLSLVDEYYAVAYTFLLHELNSSAVCIMSGLCPNNNKKSEQILIAPLLPTHTAEHALEITAAPKLAHVNVKQESSSVNIYQTPELAQLPIDLLVPPHTQVVYNSQLCVFCEYFLHYVQQVITSPKSEEEIKEVIDKACSKLPSSVNSTCVEFVDMYEPALIAILAQEIDPSQICPMLKACASNENRQDIEIFMKQGSEGSKCPLCLFAVLKLEEMVKDHKTEENIKDALSKLCSRLSQNLKEECEDFVNTYTNELVEMLVADLNPQEVCVYLKCCTDDKPPSNKPVFVGDIDTNSIMDNTVNGKPIESLKVKDDAKCVLCEFVMREVQDELKDNKTEASIKRAVHNVCNKLPTTIANECNQFVDEYADTIIQLLISTTEPDEICRMIHLCSNNLDKVKVEIGECALCESVVYAMEKILSNPRIDHNVEHVIEKACRALPTSSQEKCKEFIEKYGKTMYDLIIHLADRGLVCHEIGLCASKTARPQFDSSVESRKYILSN